MKFRTGRYLPSLMLCGLTTAALPVFADNAGMLQSVEASVKMFEARGETSNVSYVHQLISLANAYKINGRRAEAHATFRKAITIGANVKYFDVPTAIIRWAITLGYKPLETQGMTKAQLKALAVERAAYQADLPNAAKIVAEGLELVCKLPENSPQRLSYMVGTIRFYETVGDNEKMQERIKAFDDLVQSMERNPKLPPNDATLLAEKLEEISQIICWAPLEADLDNVVPIHVVPDSAPQSPFFARQADVTAAEKFRLRAVALYDKLPENHHRRIEAHRKLAKWYRYSNQPAQEKAQTQILSKMLNSTDKDVLFPKRIPCPGCGRG